MVVADPLNELDELLGDESEQSDSTPEEELGSKPSTSEGTRTQESTANFTRARSIDGEGTRTQESTRNFTQAGEGTRTNKSTDNFTRGKNVRVRGLAGESTATFTRASPSTGGGDSITTRVHRQLLPYSSDGW